MSRTDLAGNKTVYTRNVLGQSSQVQPPAVTITYAYDTKATSLRSPTTPGG